MPPRNFEAVSYIEEPPEFECRRGMFHIRQRFSANCIIERVMPPHVMFRAFQMAAQAIQDYHAIEGGDPADDTAVVRFPRAS